MMLDYIVIAGLIITAIYCWRIERRVASVNLAKQELTNLITNFDDAILRSEFCINELKKLGVDTATDIQKKIDRAQMLSNDLSFLTDRAYEISERIERISSEVNIRRAIATNYKKYIFDQNINKITSNSNKKLLDQPNVRDNPQSIDLILDRITQINQNRKNIIEDQDIVTYKPTVKSQVEYYRSLRKFK